MRTPWRTWVAGCTTALLLGAVPACKGDAAKPKVDPAIAAKAAQDERDLLARRDSLVASRSKLKTETDDVARQIEEKRAAGVDTADLEAKLIELKSQQNANKDQLVEMLEQQTTQQRNELASLRSAVGGAAPSGGGADLGPVMAKLAARDEQLANLQGQLASVIKELAAMRGDIAKQAEACGAPVAPTIITTGGDAKATKYDRRDVESLLAKARDKMAKKGLRSSDLPSPADEFERDATTAMEKADYAKAYFSAQSLVAAVDRTGLTATFIRDKIGRLSKRRRAKTLDATVQAQLDELLAQAQVAYNDGKFDQANQRLNQMEKLL